MDDEAILASLDSEPDAFAVFYRRHIAELLDRFVERTHDVRRAADLCAETFATALERAHRFDPEHESPVAWLYRIADGVETQAGYRGAVEQRARRRLGMAALELGGDDALGRFVRELEEELVLAARFRASRRANRPRIALPRKAPTIGLATLGVLAAVVVVLALSAGDDDRSARPPRTAVAEADKRPADESRTATLFADDDCEREVAPALLSRVAALHAERVAGAQLPPVVLQALAGYQLEGVVAGGARFWGRDGGVDFWVVPVAPLSDRECAPASAACVVAVTPDARADAACSLDAERQEDAWRLAPLLPGHAAIYGVVPDGVTGARVSIGGQAAQASARENVVGGVLPFPYSDTAKTRVVLLRGPQAPPSVVVVGSEP
jgi:hypothetical protein